MQKKNRRGRYMFVQNFILIAIPTLFVVCISLFLFQDVLKRYAEDYESLYMKNAMNQNMNVFERVNNDLTNSTNYIISSDDIRIFFMNEKIISESDSFQNFINTFNNIVQSSIVSNSYIKEIAIYSEINNYIYSTVESGYVDRIGSIEWMNEFKKGDRRTRYLFFEDEKEKIPVFFVPVTMYGVTMGAVIVYLDYEQLLQYFDVESFEYFHICDGNDKIILSSDINNIGKLWKSVGKSEINDGSGEYHSIISDESPYTFYMIPNNEYIEKIDKVEVSLYKIMFVSIVCILIMIVLIAFRVYFPVKKISDFVWEKRDMVQGSYSENYKKEYEFIIGNIQKTLDNNLMLREQLTEKLEKLDKMHMIALQSQINPHFLYNTLQMIVLCAEEELGSENTICNSIKLLSNLMQLKFSTQNPLTTLKVELQYLMMYYRLQHELYGDIIRLKVEIPKELDGFVIPKITLQPILENAIQSGIKPSERECTVVVSGKLSDDRLEIFISDDGIGIEENMLNDLRVRINSEELKQDSHIGLCNINQRIKLIFGNEYGITIDSEFEKGTVVGIIIPAKKMQDIIGDLGEDILLD